MFDVNSKMAHSNNAKYSIVRKSILQSGKPRRLSGRFQTLIWRPGEAVRNLESLG